MSYNLEFTTRLDNRQDNVIYIPPNCHKLIKSLSKAVNQDVNPPKVELVANQLPPLPPTKEAKTIELPGPVAPVSVPKVESKVKRCEVSHIYNPHQLCKSNCYDFQSNLYLCFGPNEYFLCKKSHFVLDNVFQQLVKVIGCTQEDPGWKPSKEKVGNHGCHIEGCAVGPSGYYRIKGVVPKWSNVEPDKVPYLYFCSFSHLNLYRSMIRYGFMTYLMTYLPNAKNRVAGKGRRTLPAVQPEVEEDIADQVVHPPTKKSRIVFVSRQALLQQQQQQQQQKAQHTTVSSVAAGKTRRNAFNNAIDNCRKRKSILIDSDGDNTDDEEYDDDDDDDTSEYEDIDDDIDYIPSDEDDVDY
ncbi:hypothetical protein SAMD00019534_041120 [Acytostelium subglobosum LB1]|uniref:hypothetical protein n=1 Tax=Acytostelium subglobosum LB1 TaxID=1410327 RepID=UPI0006448C3E|nr:hypothetical protein SAMD00019534_041120 [Acytostelium subglobosum LB1]GAM20937.1 hypothetical protein SAMD00019534_041120 [Acytostelium subglobosum LB1]|eukprot:XP_012756071.1 hypothetical protein SAMD00019534_041120 [Acytostelium subglobosum LB1]